MIAHLLTVVAASALQPLPLDKLTISHALLTCGDGKGVGSFLFIRHDREQSYIHVNNAQTGKMEFEAPIKAVLKSESAAPQLLRIESARLASGESATVTISGAADNPAVTYELKGVSTVTRRCSILPKVPELSK